MRAFLRIIVLLVLAAVLVGLWKRDDLTRLWAVNSLFAEGRIVQNFSSMDRMFHSAPLPRGDGPVSPLPQGTAMVLPEGAEDWVADRAVTSLLVLHDGDIVHESYNLGTGPDDLRISWSMAKSFLSVLTGILVDQGEIDDLDAPVTYYAPELAGSAYDGASLRDVLQMASGVEFDEDYLEFSSDINRMGRVLALGGSMDGFAQSLQGRLRPPGERWQYVSIDTHVLGMALRGATGRRVTDMMAEYLIAPLGLQADPYYVTDAFGTAFVLGGLNLTTRDYARFGQMVMQDGQWQGRQIVSADWLATSTVPSAPTAPGAEQYGYQWWIPADADEGEVYGRGVYEQYLYLDRARGVVIVVTGADGAFRDEGRHDANIAMLRRIARAATGGD
ncbi:beta-lactamase family protein [Lutimaribacter sp. EGI FJ00015]|uniref:Beta-lactamase family protein n=1 Tax=Lutimaribacter degradans TaxID=2945989 RepID=A0ACC5ZUP7_9RHOB|nr:serine hydrolase [Lutimaribacter sp. EGI FJ00013]MCM2561486.1 beta-lactamase family protein [Lutimaribacter sp. EGI FJ00013]MCO0612803.1 beta-lactamase family protein [Lutimaribacter sp. EGI FJ00015]MCO0635461.1 beta-lactamase family protein [Lutimaribacter sp. EGI FJ00014]